MIKLIIIIEEKLRREADKHKAFIVILIDINLKGNKCYVNAQCICNCQVNLIDRE